MDEEKIKLTRQQQKALHLFFRQLADTLNQNGLTMSVILQKFVLDIPATETNVKELIFRPLMEALYGKHSTTELLRKGEIDGIYDAINKFMGEMGVSCPPFPSLETQTYYQNLSEIKKYEKEK